MSHDYFWYIEPNNEGTNEQLAAALAAMGLVRESITLDASGFGKYRVPLDFLKKCWNLRGTVMKFDVYRQRGRENPLKKLDEKTLSVVLGN